MAGLVKIMSSEQPASRPVVVTAVTELGAPESETNGVIVDKAPASESRAGLCTMIASADRILVQRRESLCSRVNGGGVPAVGADAWLRFLANREAGVTA